MKITKPKFWNEKKNPIKFLFLPLSIFLQILIFLKKKVTKKIFFSIPVICVGNIYLGGTGKTPLALEIAQIVTKINKKVAIIKKSYDEHLDEFRLIESRQVPLFKNKSRILAINEAIKNKFDCVVLDDGFQDLSIHKNLNIICFNEKQLLGNDMTIPAGPLRESASSLTKCQIVIINGDKNLTFEKRIKKISNSISIYYSNYVPVNVKNFKNKNLLAFAGIGNPENFFNLLEKNNLNLTKKISFSDHYNYSLEELKKLINLSLKEDLQLITTEKDFFRIKHFQLPQIKYLKVNLEIFNKDKLQEEIIKYL
jgi:tetraacyldisaccharide 4'-kinase